MRSARESSRVFPDNAMFELPSRLGDCLTQASLARIVSDFIAALTVPGGNPTIPAQLLSSAVANSAFTPQRPCYHGPFRSRRNVLVRVRVVTYNIHKCIGGIDRRYDPLRVAQVIARYEPDLVLLQEVDQHARRSNADRQVDLLGDFLGLRHRTYFANVKVLGGGEYGNAMLSRFPMTETSNIDLTVPPKKRRSVLHARYRVRLGGEPGKPARTIHAYNLHLGLSGIERKIQLRKFLESHPFVGLHHQTPIIVAGDFNDLWGTLGRKFLVPPVFADWDR